MSTQPDLNLDYVANLARLALTGAEKAEFAQQLGDILHYVEKLKQVDVSGVEPMAHPLDAEQRLRADQVTEPDRHQAYQSVSPAVEGDLYLVPKVIE